jgi:hypothetical protein
MASTSPSMLDLIELDSQENAVIASAVAILRSSFSVKKVKVMDDIEAERDAIKHENVELSSELLIAREQLDKVTLEAVAMKNGIDALSVAIAKHGEEIKSFIELAGVGTVEEVKHILRVHREIIEKTKVLVVVETHKKV